MRRGGDPSYIADQVRRHDYDRFLCTLLAPGDRREALFALYAFNLEVAKTREAVSEPMLGLIRLQWWREAVDSIYGGTPRRHPVAEALAAAVERHALPRAAFERLIDAREADLTDDPIGDRKTLMGYIDETCVPLAEIAATVLGSEDAAAVQEMREAARAWGLTGLLRAVPFHARAKRQYLPVEMLRAAGTRPGELFAMTSSPSIVVVVRDLAAEAEARVAASAAAEGRWPKRGLAALLPAAIAAAYLRKMRRAGYDVFAPPITLSRTVRQLTVLRAAFRRRP